jgi:hypothetical protein
MKRESIGENLRFSEKTGGRGNLFIIYGTFKRYHGKALPWSREIYRKSKCAYSLHRNKQLKGSHYGG